MRAALALSVGLLFSTAAAARAQDAADADVAASDVHVARAEPTDVPELPSRLAEPTLGSTREGAHLRLFLHSESDHDTARVQRTGGEDSGEDLRCDTPCSFSLAPGEYRVWFSAVRQDATLHMEGHDVVAEGHPSDLFELVGGIVSAVAGAALLAVAFLTGEGACLDVGSTTCPIERGPLALGLGAFGIGLGLFLMFDSSGYVETETI